MIGLAVFASFFASSRSALPGNNNTYSSQHNVWAYSFTQKKYDEEYSTKQEDANHLDIKNLQLSYFDYPNANLPIIIASQQLTTFLKSLSDNEYEMAIKPILIRAATLTPDSCLYEGYCEQGYIPTEDFILRVKEILSDILSTITESVYLEIFVQKEKYLWYELYWSLDTSIDDKPVISYQDFNKTYRMCFYGMPFKTVFQAHDLMKKMLKVDFNETLINELNLIARPWINCLHYEYDKSLSMINDNRSIWVNDFLYNLTTYSKARTMTTYIYNNIQNIFYEYSTPHKLKRVLNYGTAEWLFIPIIYTLYIPAILEPYLVYMKQILADIHLFEVETEISNLALNITAFNERVPLDQQHDRAAINFIQSYSNNVTTINGKINTSTIGDFVKFATKTVVAGQIMLNFPLFRIWSQSYHLTSSIYNLMFPEKLDYRALDIYSLEDPSIEEIPIVIFHSNKKDIHLQSRSHSEPHYCHTQPRIAGNYAYHQIPNNDDINYLRRISPKIDETFRLLINVRKAILRFHPLKIDFSLLKSQCQIYDGDSAIKSQSPLARKLANLIKLYFELRHLKPYDFFSEEREIVKFIKVTYNLHNLSYFTYFQSLMLIHLQSIISVLANPSFRYTNANNNNQITTAKVQISLIKCELQFTENELNSLLISLRTMLSGKKVLTYYTGESGILHQIFTASIQKRRLNMQSLQEVYWGYRDKPHLNIVRHSSDELYAKLKDPFFKIYTFLQDPIAFSKIVSDLIIILEKTPWS